MKIDTLALRCVALCCILLLVPIQEVSAIDKIFFVGGAPLDNYQPSMSVAVLKEAFRRNGIKFSAQHYPSARSLVMTNSGEADGQLHRVSNFHEVSQGKFPNLIRIDSKILSTETMVFAVRKDLVVDSWEDLVDYIVAYKRGRQNVENALRQVAVPAINIHPLGSDEKAFELLVRGREDVVISERRGSRNLIKNNGEFANIIEIKKLGETQIYAYMHKKHQKLSQRIAETLEKMKQDGTFQSIVEEVDKAFIK